MDTTSLIVGIILGSFAIVAGTLEFLDRMGFPTPLQDKRDEKNKKLITGTLEQVGLIKHKLEVQQLGDFLTHKKKFPVTYSGEYLDGIIRKYVRESKFEKVGLFEQTSINYFVDFADAITDPEDGILLTRIMCREIVMAMSSFVDKPIYFDRVAISKSGNSSLGIRVALELQKPWVFIDVRGGVIASEAVEGLLKPEEEVIIVHDILASGKLIEIMAHEISKRGAKVNHVFVLMERTDRQKMGLAKPSEVLAKCGLKLHYISQISDRDLAKMINKN